MRLLFRKKDNGNTAGFDPGQESLPNGHQKVTFDQPIVVPQNGYIYVWVSNESENTKVWFDDLKITRSSSYVTQATDYGVWGDVVREQKSDSDTTKYEWGYQGQFAEKDEETGWNHFELREYDAVVGRWTAPDPMGQYWTPYMGMGNNPCNLVDPTGGCIDPVSGKSIPCPEGIPEAGNEELRVLKEVVVTPSYTDYFFQFMSDINPIESADGYIGGVAKTEINLMAGAKVVVPIGGIQLSANTNTGGRADYVTVEQTYLNIRKGPLDIRVIPLNEIGTGDYDPGIRALYTVHKGLITVPVGEVPVPIGEWKLQGDATLNPMTERYTIGLRGVAETFSFPSFKKGASGVRFEANAGIRLRLKVPEIFK